MREGSYYHSFDANTRCWVVMNFETEEVHSVWSKRADAMVIARDLNRQQYVMVPKRRGNEEAVPSAS